MAAHDEPRLIFPGLGDFYERFSPFSYALMRFAAGAILVPHGIQKILNTPIAKFAPNIAAKGLPFAEGLSYLTYFAESVAAACLAIGLFTLFRGGRQESRLFFFASYQGIRQDARGSETISVAPAPRFAMF